MDKDGITDDYTELRAMFNELIELYLWRLKRRSEEGIAQALNDQRPIEQFIGFLVDTAGSRLSNEFLEERPTEWIE